MISESIIGRAVHILRRRPGRRPLALAATAALVLGTIVAVAPPAQADPGPVASRNSSSGVTADALPTAQINGVVTTQVVHGNTVYAGGTFTAARPAGAAPGVNTVARNNLLAYDITTGQLISSFAPNLNGDVRALALSPDGTRLYVGGDFTSADGQDRYRMAAYDTSTGQLLSTFAPTLDTTVNAIVATSSTVYIGGAFSNANGVARARLAAFSASTGALLSWAPTADNNEVEAMIMTPDASKIIVGGSFTTMNGSSTAYGMGAVDPTTGALVPWQASSTVQDAGTASAILSLTTDGNAIYGTGYVYGAGGNLEGTFSANPSTGALNWIEDCHGDTYDSFPVNGAVYTVSHAHDCARMGDYTQHQPWIYQHAVAFTANATGTLLHNDVGGYADFGGQPSPSMINWFPTLQEGTFTGESQAAWSVSGNSQYVVLGGEFPSVNGVAQQGLVRFAVPSIAPKKMGPSLTGADYTTTEAPITSTSVRVSWPANYDPDDQTLTYQLIRDGDDSHPIYTTTATSQFWNQPTLSYVDSTVQAGSSHNYYVRVTDPDGNSVRGDYTTVTMPTTSLSTYAQQILKDGAMDYWRLGDALTSTTGVDTANADPLTEGSGVVNGAAGAVTGDPDTAATFSGTSSGTAYTANPVMSPNTFSAETWFKTTTKTGGQLLGFATTQTGTSSTDDRRLYMDNTGHLVYGINSGKLQTVASPSTYNDGAWHQAVVTQSLSGASLYVDGALVARNAQVTSPQTYSGYWRLGGDSLSGWPSAPTSSYFAGTLDETAIYPTVLSSATIQSHVTDTGRTPTASTLPTAAFTSSCPSLTCSFNASTSSAGSGATISSYAWSYGDSTTGTGVSPSHTYAAAGAKTVTLTVTDSKGGTDTVTHTVSPVAPVPPTASFTSSCTNLSCAFDASASAASGSATISSYAWKFGDTATGTGAKPTHAYTGAGTYTVTLTVTDSNGLTGTATKSITVSATPPTAAFTSSCTNLACSFDASGSSATTGATISSYAWAFGDSSSGTGVKATHTYTKAGTYTVALTVLDSNNQKTTVSHTVTVTAPSSAPTASFTNSCTNLACSFDASASTVVKGATVKSYAWAYGDKATGTGVKPTHTYTAAGTYTVTLTVTDSAGRTGTASKAVTVAAAAATVAKDAFGRTVSNGWGTADTGGAWTVDQPELFSVAGGQGQISLTAGSGASSSLAGVSALNLNTTFDVGMSQAPTGNGLFASLALRQTSSGEYRFKVLFQAGGSVHLVIAKETPAEGETVIQEVAVTGLTYTAGTLLHARVQITGTGTTTITGKVWSGSTEPAANQISVTDNEAALQSAGGIGTLVYLAGNATNAPAVLYDNLDAVKA